MILYTILDPNVIFKNDNLGQQQGYSDFGVMKVEGVLVQVSHSGNSDIRVERIISTNPFDYLNPKIQPGCIVHS